MNVLRRRDTEAIVDGRNAGTPRLDAVAEFVHDLREQAALAPAPAPRPRLASTLDGRRPLRPASDPIPPRPPVPFPSRLRGIRSFRPATVLLAAGAVFFGGLATAGALPGPLQNASADLTQHVGIHLPGATPARPVQPKVDPGTDPAQPPATPRSGPGASTPTSGTTTTTRAPGATPTSVPHAPVTVAPPKVPVALPPSGPIALPVPVSSPLPTLPTIPTITLPTLPRHQLSPTTTP